MEVVVVVVLVPEPPLHAVLELGDVVVVVDVGAAVVEVVDELVPSSPC